MDAEIYERLDRTFSDSADVPIDGALFYHCLNCDGVIPSIPDDNVSCPCGDLYVDVDYHRLAVQDFRKFEVLVRKFG